MKIIVCVWCVFLLAGCTRYYDVSTTHIRSEVDSHFPIAFSRGSVEGVIESPELSLSFEDEYLRGNIESHFKLTVMGMEIEDVLVLTLRGRPRFNRDECGIFLDSISVDSLRLVHNEHIRRLFKGAVRNYLEEEIPERVHVYRAESRRECRRMSRWSVADIYLSEDVLRIKLERIPLWRRIFK